MRVRGLTILLLVAGLLLVIPTALAKGPAGATIEGDGIKGTLVIDQGAEVGQGTAMSQLVDSVGFFELAFGERKPLTEPPTRVIGKQRLIITWDMGSGNTIVQEVYHRAEGGPVTYIEPGRRIWDSTTTTGGWFRVTGDIETPLIELGVSPDAFPNAAAAAVKSATDTQLEPVTNAESSPATAATPASAVAPPNGSAMPTGSTADGRAIAGIAVAVAVLVAAAGAGTWARRRRPMPH